MSPMMTEAIDREDWELMDKGLPPRKKPQRNIVPPTFPKIENQVKFEDIPLDRFERLISARRRAITNEDGVKFVGMDVVIELKIEKKLGRPPEKKESQPKDIKGWMMEGDWQKFYLHTRKKLDFKVISY